MSVIKRPYRILMDFPKIYEFLSVNYSIDWRRGVPAPYFEYAQSHCMFDPTKTHRIALWEDEGTMVAMAFYEMILGKAFFSISDGYEYLCNEMIDHAEQFLCDDNGKVVMCPISSQTAVRDALVPRGYSLQAQWTEAVYTYDKGALSYDLPDGFSFALDDDSYDLKKLNACIWQGFDHGEQPEYDIDRFLHMNAAPHARSDINVTVVAPNGDYACFGGMWIDEPNSLAYLEPLCTVPKYRHMGLASAVISELYRRTIKEGATHMTGGDNPFYYTLGFEEKFKYECWEK